MRQAIIDDGGDTAEPIGVRYGPLGSGQLAGVLLAPYEWIQRRWRGQQFRVKMSSHAG